MMSEHRMGNRDRKINAILPLGLMLSENKSMRSKKGSVTTNSYL